MKLEMVDMTGEYICAAAEIDKACFSDFWNEKIFKNESKNPSARYAVCIKDGLPAGYMGYIHASDEADIVKIAVKNEFRRMGIASHIMEYMLKKAEDDSVRHMTLEVRESNTAAIELYKKFDFKIAGIRKKYYSDLENAYIMIREW